MKFGVWLWYLSGISVLNAEEVLTGVNIASFTSVDDETRKKFLEIYQEVLTAAIDEDKDESELPPTREEYEATLARHGIAFEQQTEST